MKNKSLYKIMRCGIFAAIICVSSFLVIPFGTVPISAALLAIMLCGVVLSPLEAFFASFTYVLMGILGLPVFSGGSSGIGVLLGITGGYIWSYPILAVTVSAFAYIRTKSKRKKWFLAFCGCLCGMVVCYTCGTLQYMAVANVNIYTALVVCVVPFLILDILKALVAVGIGNAIKNRI